MTLAYSHDDFANRANLANVGDTLDRMGVRMAFAKDEEIYAQDDEADFVYRVVSGSVRTTLLMSDGRRQIGEFYYPGDIFGLEPGPAHRYSAEALCDGVVLVLKRSALKAAGADADLQAAIWDAMTRELERAQEHVLLLGRKTACEKVASFLSDLSHRRPGAELDLPMSRQDMADYLGLTIETVSRMLSQLQNNAILEFAGCRHVRIKNPAALARLAE
jgi:CRP/FNR family nitrogen fixation transcriptional regulator